MLIAFGDFEMNSLLDGIVRVAKDENMLHELNQRLGMGSWQHPDGWGIAYLKEGEWVVEKSTTPIFEDQENVDRFKDIKTNLAIVHVRKKFKGDVHINNCHPFHDNDHIFCHNGVIRDEIIVDGPYQPKGETDSEAFFHSILNQGEDYAELIKKGFKEYRNTKGTNIFMAGKEKTHIGIRENLLPIYYNMKMSRDEKSLIIASEELPGLDREWETLQPSILIIDNKTREISAHEYPKIADLGKD
jgi:predicted glutamine amidotransferase